MSIRTTHDLMPLQREVLRAFFERESGFFLTGGAALVGFYLHHRDTDDLDLFAVDAETYDRGRHVLADAATSLGASLEVRQSAPGFQRFVVSRGDDAVVVDLVHDRVPQIRVAKPTVDGIRVDAVEEIIANKITTILSRAEERDLVDLFCLERAGHSIEAAIDSAIEKDGGATPATLAWLLSEISIPDGATLPGGIDPLELRAWLADLLRRLRRKALPSGA